MSSASDLYDRVLLAVLGQDIGCGQPLREDLDVSEFRDLRQARRQALEDRLDVPDRVRLANPLAVEEIVFGQCCLPFNAYVAIVP